MTESETHALAAIKSYRDACAASFQSGRLQPGVFEHWDAVTAAYRDLPSDLRGRWFNQADFCAAHDMTPLRELVADFRG